MEQNIETKNKKNAAGPIAENHITITRKLFNEGRLASRSENYRRNVLRLSGILALILIITALWLLCTGGSLIYLAGEVIFIAALLIWLSFILPGTGGKNRYQAMTRGASAPQRTTVFYQDHLEVTTESGRKVTVPYQNIKKISESKNLWVLSCKGRIGVMIKKDGFTAGNMDAVRESINFHSENK